MVVLIAPAAAIDVRRTQYSFCFSICHAGRLDRHKEIAEQHWPEEMKETAE